ncbi:stress-inducible protein [Streptomyces pluripotens]|uniref:Stress-inducible protein n=1 Tax=Streptomyces pluripotens TaxID=1355015 RepID=A0A221P6L4_9ACTN|nr:MULTISPECIES: universal stress protein [Streptomyces]ARP73513.1 stress-inducible protein [Streptomyces pluripotens]ASN27764.1 stress-inducible protein [Streptomyces pluripotens]KIE26835.1 stress-inducible protein [Streptomyces sp. MUSC 125]MCH0557321.1 universal stress protein [Streptomyces sp. MUM 16J]
MSRTVTVGLDGSPESRAAAEWAAREARLRDLSLCLVHVWEPVPAPVTQTPLLGAEPNQRRHERSETTGAPAEGWGDVLGETAAGLRLRHPGLEVLTEQRNGSPGDELAAAAGEAELLALGSRGLSGIGGFLVGSVGLSVVAHARRPVVLVRAGEQAADEHESDPVGIPSAATAYRPVVVGVDTAAPDDTVLAFAFDEAARRGTTVRAVHAWSLPMYYGYGLAADPTYDQELSGQEEAALTEVLRPWRKKYPSVEVVEECGPASASVRLVDAALTASLVVVGRRERPGPFGAHIGPVTHAVLHHATTPVAVVPHD